MRFVGLIMAFFVVVIMGFLSVSFIATQDSPDPINDTVAYNQYTNQTETVEVAFAGLNGGLLLLILAIVLAAGWLLIKVIR